MLKIDFVGTNSNNDSSSIEISEIVYAKQEQGRCTTSQGRGNKHEVITKALSKSPVRPAAWNLEKRSEQPAEHRQDNGTDYDITRQLPSLHTSIAFLQTQCRPTSP